MATCWAKCPDLFLYTKGKDVYLWRCNETTWMPMKTADFDDLGKVMDHQDLIGGKDAVFDWEESSYNDLVAYISSRRLLVNCRGLVIAELHEFDQDGKMEENGLPFYIRSLDVLSLKPFGLRNRTIPSRMVLYLETEGEAANVEEDSNTTTTTTNMEKQVAELKAANKTLKSDKEAAERKAEKAQQERDAANSDKEALKSDKETAERKAEKAQQERDAAKIDKETAERKAEKAQQERDAAKIDKEALKSDKEAAERKAEKAQQERDAANNDNEALKSDKETAERKTEKAQQERDAAKSDKETAERKAEKAQQERDAAKIDKETAERKAADLQTQIDSLAPINEKKEEVWMNKFSDQIGIWKTFDGLNKEIYCITVNGVYHSSVIDHDLSTNVQAKYMQVASLADARNKTSLFIYYDAVRLNDLIPNKEKARFDVYKWYRGTCNGEMYAIKKTFPNTWSIPPPEVSSKLSDKEVKSLNYLLGGS